MKTLKIKVVKYLEKTLGKDYKKKILKLLSIYFLSCLTFYLLSISILRMEYFFSSIQNIEIVANVLNLVLSIGLILISVFLPILILKNTPVDKYN